MEVVFFSFELGRGVHFGGADFLYGHLHIVHPLHHLAVPGVVHLPDEGVVLLPERHVEALSASEALTTDNPHIPSTQTLTVFSYKFSEKKYQ